jgi:hypothetical protein
LSGGAVAGKFSINLEQNFQKIPMHFDYMKLQNTDGRSSGFTKASRSIATSIVNFSKTRGATLSTSNFWQNIFNWIQKIWIKIF